ncbi:two-component system, response regulator YesN [Paenibacillus catalpae]|uniref:Two-component system, response regulator YesN n=1 Tax=Paenibacillus catalpae TaxID=1045775 RepID=A0A1I1SZS7_9BACL|nr:response regulator [Paenibacillus catalpae]SFD50278.1 two-component system, response regulator YesN [Paenibacillus catalpae]
MHRILIVDDERIEREGIRNLIRKLKLELDPLVAENGEAALRIVQSEPIDIVITDIKMPFMDGLELSEKIREEHPDIELIIYSAFNEFEYARRAMRANVSNYLLKPIQVPEFLTAIQRATDACLEKEAERKRELQLLEGYRLGMAYEREKMLLDAINGIRPNKPLAAPAIDEAVPEFIHLLLVECPRLFFDMYNDDFFSMLHERLNLPFDYLNVNANQSILFVRHSAPLSREILRSLAETVSASTLERYGQQVGIIVGAAAEGWDGVHQVYCGIERLLEFKFFINEQAILFAEEHFSESSFDEAELQTISEKIYQCLNFSDLRGAKYGVELLFSYLKTTGHFSSLYTKFLCSEIMNRVLVKEQKKSLAVINDYLDKISRTSSLHELKDLMFGVFDLVDSSSGTKHKEESANKIIEQIKQMIEEQYDQDLSLEGIAEQVYLTPSYLSYLFKKETGQSLIRYITQVRMDKAVMLLRDTNMKIVDICQKLGYRNSNYFIQSFRQHYGVTPAKFRERTP